jgi:hypothetical protein
MTVMGNHVRFCRSYLLKTYGNLISTLAFYTTGLYMRELFGHGANMCVDEAKPICVYSTWQPRRVVYTKEVIAFARVGDDSEMKASIHFGIDFISNSDQTTNLIFIANAGR